MKKVLTVLSLGPLTITLVAATLAASTVFANPSAMPDSASQSPLTYPVDPETSTSQSERLNKRKASLKFQQSEQRKQIVISRCSAVKEKFKKVKNDSEKASKSRTEKYEKLARQLDGITNKLTSQKVDTKQLKIEQAKFNAALNRYLQGAADFDVAAGDILSIDCSRDPAGFEATILSARQLRSQLAKDASDAKATVPLIRKELDTIRQSLAAATAGGQTQ